MYNETVSIKENICKPFVASSVSFLLTSVKIACAFIYFYVNLRSKKICGQAIRYVKHKSNMCAQSILFFKRIKNMHREEESPVV